MISSSPFICVYYSSFFSLHYPLYSCVICLYCRWSVHSWWWDCVAEWQVWFCVTSWLRVVTAEQCRQQQWTQQVDRLQRPQANWCHVAEVLWHVAGQEPGDGLTGYLVVARCLQNGVRTYGMQSSHTSYVPCSVTINVSSFLCHSVAVKFSSCKYISDFSVHVPSILQL